MQDGGGCVGSRCIGEEDDEDDEDDDVEDCPTTAAASIILRRLRTRCPTIPFTMTFVSSSGIPKRWEWWWTAVPKRGGVSV